MAYKKPLCKLTSSIYMATYCTFNPLSLITQNTENKPFGEITDSGTRGELQSSWAQCGLPLVDA